MTTATDIRSALREVGASISITKANGQLVTGEYIDVDTNAQVTKWFVREYFLEGTFQFDTQASVGDLVHYSSSGRKYLVMNLDPVFLENGVIEQAAVMYKANVSGELLRPSGETRDLSSYLVTTVWDCVASGCYALMAERLFGQDLETDQQLASVGLAANDLYIPNRYGLQINDRYQVKSGEYYRVEQIKTRNFNGVDVIVVGEDTR